MFLWTSLHGKLLTSPSINPYFHLYDIPSYAVLIANSEDQNSANGDPSNGATNDAQGTEPGTSTKLQVAQLSGGETRVHVGRPAAGD